MSEAAARRLFSVLRSALNAAAPAYTLPGGLERERGMQPPSVTELERMALQGRWGS